MLVYLVLIATIIFANFLLKENRISKKQFCILVGIGFILITGLRSPGVGSDTTGYYFSFLDLKYLSWDELWAMEKRDWGYYLLAWILSKTTGSFTVLTLVTAVTFYYPVMKLLYKYSDDLGLSCLVMFAFNFFQFSMTGIRQTIAFGFAILFFLAIHEKRSAWSIIKAILFVFLATAFHRSAFIILLYIPIKYLSKSRVATQLSVLLIPIIYLLRRTIVRGSRELLIELDFDALDFGEIGGGLTTFLMYIAFVLASFFLSTDDGEDEIPANEIILLAIVSTAFQSMVLVESVLFRAAWYFAIFFIIMIPKFIKKANFGHNERKIFGILGYSIVLYMYFFITRGSAYVLPYRFFWQG